MFPTIYLASLGNLDLDPLWPHSEHLGHASCQDPAEVGEATQLQTNAGVVGRPHHHQLQELDRVQRGNDLGHQLGHNHHHHAGQQTSLQEHSLHQSEVSIEVM